MKFSIPPIKEPLFLSGTILSPVWVKWFDSLFTAVQSIDDSSTLLTMQNTHGEMSTSKSDSPLLNFIPKANDQSSNDAVSSVGIDVVMSMVSKSVDRSTTESIDIQTLYWMGV
jgi:hypothetical protein